MTILLLLQLMANVQQDVRQEMLLVGHVVQSQWVFQHVSLFANLQLELTSLSILLKHVMTEMLWPLTDVVHVQLCLDGFVPTLDLSSQQPQLVLKHAEMELLMQENFVTMETS